MSATGQPERSQKKKWSAFELNCVKSTTMTMEQAPINIANSIWMAGASPAIAPYARMQGCQSVSTCPTRMHNAETRQKWPEGQCLAALLTNPNKSKSTKRSTRLCTRNFRSSRRSIRSCSPSTERTPPQGVIPQDAEKDRRKRKRRKSKSQQFWGIWKRHQHLFHQPQFYAWGWMRPRGRTPTD